MGCNCGKADEAMSRKPQLVKIKVQSNLDIKRQAFLDTVKKNMAKETHQLKKSFRISEAEALQLSEQWFIIADKNANGKISIEEFIKFARWLDQNNNDLDENQIKEIYLEKVSDLNEEISPVHFGQAIYKVAVAILGVNPKSQINETQDTEMSTTKEEPDSSTIVQQKSDLKNPEEKIEHSVSQMPKEEDISNTTSQLKESESATNEQKDQDINQEVLQDQKSEQMNEQPENVTHQEEVKPVQQQEEDLYVDDGKEYDFNDSDLGDEEAHDKFMEQFEKENFKELTEEQELELVVGKVQVPKEKKMIFGVASLIHGPVKKEESPFQRQKIVNIDKMGKLYVPYMCRDQFFFLRVKRKWRFIIFKLCDEDNEFVEIDKCGLRDCTFEQFQEHVPSDGARWIFYDLEFSKTEQGKELMKNKIVFIIYTPSGCPGKHKTTMTYQRQQFKQNVTSKTGVNPHFMEYQAHSLDDLTYQKIVKKC